MIEMMKENRYSIVLIEKEGTDGLNREDVLSLFELLDSEEFYPIELEAREQECSAMGFITTMAAEELCYDYERSGLHDFVASILDNMNNESSDCCYMFAGLHIFMTR